MSGGKSSFVEGLINMVTASLFFAVMGALVKVAGDDIGSVEIVFFRNFFGTFFMLVSIIRSPLQNKGGRPWLLAFRGIAGTIALLALFYNMTQIGLGVAITFLQTSPIFVAVFGRIFLKEKLNWMSWVAIITGFAGILCIFRPDLDSDWTTNLLGLLNGVLAGAAYTSVRRLRENYETRTIVLSFLLSGAIIPVTLLIIGENVSGTDMQYFIAEFVMPQDLQWMLLLFVAATSLGGQMFVTKAYGKAKAGIIAAIGYVTIPFSLIIGLFLGDPFPDIMTITGMILIIISGIIISLSRNK